MPNLRGLLSGIASTAGQAFEGYGIDKQLRVKNLMAEQEAKRAADRDKVLASVANSTIDENTARAEAYRNPAPRVQIAPDGTAIIPVGYHIKRNADGTVSAERDAVSPAPTSAASPTPPVSPTPPTVAPIGGPSEQGPPAQTPPAPKSVVDVVRSQGQPAPAEKPINFARPAADRTESYANYVDPEGGVHLTTGADAAGKGWTRQTSTASAGTARGFGQGGIFGGASALGSIGEMRTVMPGLEAFEFGLLSENPDSPTIKAFDTFRQKILDAGRHSSGAHGAIATSISAALQAGAADEMVRINPQLARYGRDLAAWIVSDLNLTRGATDERGRWDQVASSVLNVPISDMPFGQRRRYIQDVVATRKARLAGLEQAVPAAERMLENIATQGGKLKPKAAPPAPAPPSGNAPPAGAFDIDAYITQFPTKKP